MKNKSNTCFSGIWENFNKPEKQSWDIHPSSLWTLQFNLRYQSWSSWEFKVRGQLQSSYNLISFSYTHRVKLSSESHKLALNRLFGKEYNLIEKISSDFITIELERSETKLYSQRQWDGNGFLLWLLKRNISMIKHLYSFVRWSVYMGKYLERGNMGVLLYKECVQYLWASFCWWIHTLLFYNFIINSLHKIP